MHITSPTNAWPLPAPPRPHAAPPAGGPPATPPRPAATALPPVPPPPSPAAASRTLPATHRGRLAESLYREVAALTSAGSGELLSRLDVSA